MDPTHLDPGTRDYLDHIRDIAAPGPFTDAIDQRRVQMEHLAAVVSPRNAPGIETRDWYVAAPGREIPLRVYRPESTGPKPLVLYVHGGGWVAGSIETHDYLAAALARDADCLVISVQYRRAPENRHPAQIDDCWEALLWAVAHAPLLGIDATRIAVAGDSAGAHLATLCAQRARDRGGPALAFQLLIYPMIEPNFESGSYRSHADAPGLTRADGMLFWRGFLGEDLSDPPAHAVPSANPLTGLPPVAMLTVELDPLRDEGEAYARKLEEAGVPVALRRAPGLIHGCMRMGAFSAAVRAETDWLFRQLRGALHP